MGMPDNALWQCDLWDMFGGLRSAHAWCVLWHWHYCTVSEWKALRPTVPHDGMSGQHRCYMTHNVGCTAKVQSCMPVSYASAPGPQAHAGDTHQMPALPLALWHTCIHTEPG